MCEEEDEGLGGSCREVQGPEGKGGERYVRKRKRELEKLEEVSPTGGARTTSNTPVKSSQSFISTSTLPLDLFASVLAVMC